MDEITRLLWPINSIFRDRSPNVSYNSLIVSRCVYIWRTINYNVLKGISSEEIYGVMIHPSKHIAPLKKNQKLALPIGDCIVRKIRRIKNKSRELNHDFQNNFA